MFEKYLQAVEQTEAVKYTGIVERIQGSLIESSGPQAVIGEICRIDIPRLNKEIPAEVVAIKGQKIQLMAFDDLGGIEAGCRVTATGELLSVRVSSGLLGRILDSQGRPIDGKGGIGSLVTRPVMGHAPHPMDRLMIRKQLFTGVRAIDGLVPIGCGQRMGIFSGAGVGKSTLLGMIARNTRADVNVIALIGERGMEVPRFLENDLGPEGLKRSVVVVSTSDTSAVARVRGAFTATAIAEYFRDQGKDVLLLFDSVTRFAMAQREIGLAIGEPPASRGYPPSLLTVLPKLLERTGATKKGSITGIYTILVEGDDMDEPVADAVRGILDGHIILSRKIAQRNQYPALDILQSVTRVEGEILSAPMRKRIGLLRKWLAIHAEKEDLINVGAYVKGSSPEIDTAVERSGHIWDFMKQEVSENADPDQTIQAVADISGIPLTEGEAKREAVSVFA
jgi:flagellum-specific ATP synthase